MSNDAGSQNQSPSQGQGGDSGPNSDVRAGGQAGAAGAGTADGFDALNDADRKATDPNTSRFLTKEAFRGILDKHRQGLKEELSSVQKFVEKAIGDKIAAIEQKLADTLSAAGKPKGKGGKDGEGGGAADDVELNSMRKQLEESKRAMDELRAQLDSERKRAQDNDKKVKVVDVLRKLDCTRPEAVYAIVEGRIQVAEDGKLFATAKSEWGDDTRVSIEDFLKEVRETELPELFKGMTSRDSRPDKIS